MRRPIKLAVSMLELKREGLMATSLWIIYRLKTLQLLTAPYADSILMASRYNKMRILEALISYYDDNDGTRAQRTNETDPATGRNSLHYLCYMGNKDMILEWS